MPKRRSLHRSPVRGIGREPCYWCGRPMLPTGTLVSDGRSHLLAATREHLIPRGLGGSNHFTNLVLACYECNTNRGLMSEPEFREFLKTYTFKKVP